VYFQRSQNGIETNRIVERTKKFTKNRLRVKSAAAYLSIRNLEKTCTLIQNQWGISHSFLLSIIYYRMSIEPPKLPALMKWKFAESTWYYIYFIHKLYKAVVYISQRKEKYSQFIFHNASHIIPSIGTYIYICIYRFQLLAWQTKTHYNTLSVVYLTLRDWQLYFLITDSLVFVSNFSTNESHNCFHFGDAFWNANGHLTHIGLHFCT
jgi:hypothetical protein